MLALLDLPHEVLQNILGQVEPADLGQLSSTCRLLRDFIGNNTLLFRELYLRHFDNPVRDPSDPEPVWEEVLPKLVRLEKLLLSSEIYVKTANAPFIAQTIIDLLASSKTNASNPRAPQSPNILFLRRMFERQLNVDTILCSSSLFEDAGTDMHIPSNVDSERQLSAKLHCLYGVPISKESYEYLAEKADSEKSVDFIPTHPYARARVYDLRRYTVGSVWGPFVDDGSMRVDWEKVEAIMIDLGYNMDLFSYRTDGRFPPIWSEPWAGAAPYSFESPPFSSSLPKEVSVPLDSQDPYGVSGTWMRIVCFLDYSEFYAFNFAHEAPPLGEHREPISTEEATRIICMRLIVSKIEPPEDGDGKRLPVVHFKGTSRSMHRQWDPNANSDIKGSVRLTEEDEIRWTTFSIYFGEERWRSEGIQVGGLQSARGVLGNWFDSQYDMHGPAGPTAFWKVTNEVNREESESQPLFHF